MNRANGTRALRFQERDGTILKDIHRYDGVLAKRHLKVMFWPTASSRAMEKRLSLLYHNGYLEWPTRDQRRSEPIPEPIVWLGWRGAMWVAASYAVEVEPPKNDGENQLRSFAMELRKRGFHWQREPRWSQLKHDLAVVDVRMSVEQTVNGLQDLTLEEWVSEHAFRLHMDVVECKVRRADGKVIPKNKGVRPDGYFVLVDEKRQSQGRPARARFLFEMDMVTHDPDSFIEEKAIAGAAYIKSAAYQARFGANAGRWLVVTTGERRMRNLMRQTHQALGNGASVFLFTLLEAVKSENMLTSPIWHEAGREQPLALISS
jgi:hypothetical protein